MCERYYVRGTITVRFEEDTLCIGVTPSAGFLSPDKSPRAIAFPLPKGKPEHENSALLISLNETKSCDFAGGSIQASIPALLSIAGQNKNIELHVSAEQPGNPAPKHKIVGFVYPAP